MARTLFVDLTSELPLATAWTKEHSRQLPFSVSQALNASIQGSRFIAGSKENSALSALSKMTKAKLDRPKPQTVTGYRATTAKKRALVVDILPKDRPFDRRRYLEGNYLGGERVVKPFEIAFAANSRNAIPLGTRFVPTGAVKPDQYGNVRKSQISKILDGLGNTGRTGSNHFIGKPRGGNRPAGVYRRERGHKLRPLFLVDSSVSYQASLTVFTTVTDKLRSTFDLHLRQQLAKNVQGALPSRRSGSF